jgi:glycine cleavage system protein P-like pyridoxal-binding family
MIEPTESENLEELDRFVTPWLQSKRNWISYYRKSK